MKKTIQLFVSFLAGSASNHVSKMRPKRLILGLALVAAVLSVGCPKNDPLEAFNSPSTPIDPGPAPVPEPVTALLFGTALLVGGAIARRRRNAGKKIDTPR
jgi:hypothetical protein